MGRKPWAERYAKHLKSQYWAELKRKVVKRRGKVCERCKNADCSLDLHHMHYRTFGKERQKDVQLLCRECHKIEDMCRKQRGDANRVKALLERNDQWWSGSFTDVQVCTMIRGGVLDMNDIGHVIDCWDSDDFCGTKGGNRNDLFRSTVRELYEKHCGSREEFRKRHYVLLSKRIKQAKPTNEDKGL